MPRIAVVLSHPPFTEGGHTTIARGLVAALRAAGHQAETVFTPQNRFGRQGAAYVATWLTDVGESDGKRIDQVISLRYPAYAVRHPRHVCWLLHTMREYYDLWPGFRARLSWKNRLKEGVRRRIVHAADRRLLAPSRLARLCVISSAVQRRLQSSLGLRSEVLHPPPPVRDYRCDAYSDEFLVVSRLTPLKRIDLAIRALAEEAGRRCRLAVAGSGDQDEALRALARELGVEGRVRFLGGLSDAELVAAYAVCRAVVFTPSDEDYGFVTAEAFASSKAVVTCTDSGGPTDLVTDGQEGFVAEPTPEAVARAMRRLLDDPALARAMGERARLAASAMNWPRVVERLVLVR
jgi:glycosyltransferase involved in cell wall biosynthesis